MEYIAEKDIWCEEKRMPMSVHGFVCRKFGERFMVINADLSDEAKAEAIRHEFDHIDNDDLYSDETAIEIESRMEGNYVHQKESFRELDVPI